MGIGGPRSRSRPWERIRMDSSPATGSAPSRLRDPRRKAGPRSRPISTRPLVAPATSLSTETGRPLFMRGPIRRGSKVSSWPGLRVIRPRWRPAWSATDPSPSSCGESRANPAPGWRIRPMTPGWRAKGWSVRRVICGNGNVTGRRAGMALSTSPRPAPRTTARSAGRSSRTAASVPPAISSRSRRRTGSRSRTRSASGRPRTSLVAA